MTEQALNQLTRRIVLDAARLEYGGLLEGAPEHTFSPAFERKMKKLLRRGRHPVLYRTLRAAACLLLVLLLSGCAVLVVSPAAREVFLGWVREFRTLEGFPPYYIYTYAGEEAETLPDGVAYRPTWVPEGYELFDELPPPGLAWIFFENEEGQRLHFVCMLSDAYGNMSVTMEEGDRRKPVEVNGQKADLYLTEGGRAHLIWSSEDALFSLIGDLPEESLIRVAESVCLTLPRQAPHRPSWHPEDFYLGGSSGEVEAHFDTEDGRSIHSNYVRPEKVDETWPEIQKSVAGLIPRTVQVQGSDAELYETREGSSIVWPTEDGLYWLYGPVEGEILLRIAESIGQEP